MCFCGDTHCNSCGIMQGNLRCTQCGAWEDEGGCDNPEQCSTLLLMEQIREEYEELCGYAVEPEEISC